MDRFEGKRADKRIADEEDYRFPEGTTLYQDKGFQGYDPSGATVSQPKKKPKGRELTEEEITKTRRSMPCGSRPNTQSEGESLTDCP